MLRNAAAERKEKCDQHQWQRHDGEDDVAGKQWQVDRPQSRVCRVAHIAVQRVVQDVADQKQRGEAEGGDHGRAMRLDIARPDEGVADEQGSGRQAVEDCVQRGQKSVLRAGSRGGMNVDEPEQKQGCRRADEPGWPRWPGAYLIGERLSRS